MSNGSFQSYQHYLPATYIRQFKSNESTGKNNILGFVKIEASKDQAQKRIVPLNATKICGSRLRHTIIINGEKDNFIENCFSEIEKLYPSFIKIITQYYKTKAEFYSCKGLHYFIKANHPFRIKKQNHGIIKSLIRIYEIDCRDIVNISFLVSRFLCYRLENMDSFYESHQKPKLKECAKSIKEIFKENKQYYPHHENIISKEDWRSFLLLLRDSSNSLHESSLEKKKELISAYNKIHRYLVSPFLSIGDESNIKVYIHRALNDESIVSCDNPFIFFKNDNIFSNGCVFTISPQFALIFSSTPINIKYVNKTEEPDIPTKNISDMISTLNIENAKKYIFSNERKKLEELTRHIIPQCKQSIHHQSSIHNNE
ncbi:DUF4238 domain-containing protein [Edwardsiella tarda]|uniref:DUF4238 domain-containing protein n=1 Tax=Edwardsiella tarda TaxID=636 RepID=UPI00083A6F96|nr:DUF4238 domain-containing protein [Edwardsiella tarda]